MLLTALCVLYDSGGRLPEDRYELYRRIVNNVLFHRFRGDAREREPVKGAAGSDRARHAHRRRPVAAAEPGRRNQWSRDRTGAAGVRRRRTLATRAVGSSRRCGARSCLTRSGLLLPRPNDRAAFYHLSFQEFLAAERIVRTADDLCAGVP